MDTFWEISDEDRAALEVIYPADGAMTVDDAVYSCIRRDMETMMWAFRVRTDAATSGAMRWPWSQEARIDRSDRVV